MSPGTAVVVVLGGVTVLAVGFRKKSGEMHILAGFDEVIGVLKWLVSRGQ